ncbi:MAG TPA: hypothetical protein VER55_01645, partial [Ardenticatenaceae bacterium]|nr:hypothetical protein [Ardenticatenaceae bacterium]
SAPQTVAGIEGVAEDVQYEAPAEPQPTLARRLLGWLTRTGLILVGFVLLGWLLLRLAPNLLLRPADELSERPAVAGIYGLIAAVLFLVIPLLSALIVVLIGIFWGVGPALIVALFLLAAFALIWVFSPLVSGLWLGRAISRAMGRTFSNLPALALGVVILALLGRVPCLGAIVYLLSFILALGAIILARRSEPPRPLPPLAPPAVGSDFEAAPLAKVRTTTRFEER